MLKYTDVEVTFAEIPDEITLCINLSNCPCHCEGCHSSYLAEDIGEVLTFSKIERLLEKNKGVTAICFMGGDNDPGLVSHYAGLIKNEKVRKVVKNAVINCDINIPEKRIYIPKGDSLNIVEYANRPIKVGWYSGRQELSNDIDLDNFDFIKLGPYLKEYGPLNCNTTNQKFYKIVDGNMIDITYKFWRK